MMLPALSLGLTRRAGGAGSSYSAEATALFARFSSQPDATRKGHIDTLITALKDDGIWDKMDALYILAAHDAQAAQRNWKADAFNLTEAGTITFAADDGYTGNGTTGYLETGFNPTAEADLFSLDSAHMGVWSLTNAQRNGTMMGGRTASGTAEAWFNPRNTSDQVVRRFNDATTDSGANLDSSGLFTHVRTASNATVIYRNAVSIDSSAVVSTAMPNVTFHISALNTGGTAGSFDNRQLSIAHLGSSLTSTEVTDLHAAFSAYLTAVGAI